jgi:hypothetical protein
MCVMYCTCYKLDLGCDDTGVVPGGSILDAVNSGAIMQMLQCVRLQAEGLWLQLCRGMRAVPPMFLVLDFGVKVHMRFYRARLSQS